MSEDKKKKRYRDIHGTTRVGDFLRSLNFKKIAEVVGNVATGDVQGAIEALSKDPNALTQEQREYALKLIELDLEDMKGVTQRWASDMEYGTILSKNVRPLTLIFLTLSTVALIVADSQGIDFNVGTEWIDLLKSLLITVFVAYFGGRSFEKTKRL
jgi:hypothetical protein